MNTDLPTIIRAWMSSPAYVEMTDRQKLLLSLICDHQGPHHVRGLATALSLDKSVVSRNCDKFVTDGLLRRVPSLGDRRDCTFEPTPEGLITRNAMRLSQPH